MNSIGETTCTKTKHKQRKVEENKKKLRQLGCQGNLMKCDMILLDAISDKMIININMFGFHMMDRVVS